jgi:hypothetical protein
MQGNVSMNKDGDTLLVWRLRRHHLLCDTTATLLLPFMSGPDPGPLPTNWSNHAAQSPRTLAPLTCALLNNFRDVAYLPVHLKHVYPIKDKSDISVKISAA